MYQKQKKNCNPLRYNRAGRGLCSPKCKHLRQGHVSEGVRERRDAHSCVGEGGSAAHEGRERAGPAGMPAAEGSAVGSANARAGKGQGLRGEKAPGAREVLISKFRKKFEVKQPSKKGKSQILTCPPRWT